MLKPKGDNIGVIYLTLVKKTRRCSFYVCKHTTNKEQKYFGRCVAKNGKEVWRTSETYWRKVDVINAIKIVKPDNIFKRFENWINDN